ncbi:MAG: arginine deiminase-related protein [Tissierellia bacterium]|nr:arginine deiminase-related protein [Tissierellia bacterium]
MYTHIIARTPSRSMVKGLRREDIGVPDYELALEQHKKYVETMESLGLVVEVLPALEDYPDSCFVEDVAVVTEKMAIITNPATEQRNGEKEHIVETLKKYYPEDRIHFVTEGYCEGGDIIRADNHFFLGETERSNEAGRAQFISFVEQYGYTGSTIPMPNDALHLGSDMTYIMNNNMLITGELVDNPAFDQYNKVIASKEEGYAANGCWINGTVLMAEGFPEVIQKVKDLGYEVITLNNSEFKKIDGSMTCLSLRFTPIK